ncbi:Protein of unknown function [Gryllus bimaculatus]|nr:Protein of unknown function [Gryllus bimaculatus]
MLIKGIAWESGGVFVDVSCKQVCFVHFMMKCDERVYWRKFAVFCCFFVVFVGEVKSEELQCTKKHFLSRVELEGLLADRKICWINSEGQNLTDSDCIVWDLGEEEDMQYRLQVGNQAKVCHKLQFNQTASPLETLRLSFACQTFGWWAADVSAEMMVNFGYGPSDISSYGYFVMKIPPHEKNISLLNQAKAYLKYCWCPGPMSAYRQHGKRLKGAMKTANAKHMLDEELPVTPLGSRRTRFTQINKEESQSENMSMGFTLFPGPINEFPLLGVREGSVVGEEDVMKNESAAKDMGAPPVPFDVHEMVL